MSPGIEITNLGDFQADIHRAIDANAPTLAKAVKAGGDPVLERAKDLAPRDTGTLAASGRNESSGATGSIVFAGGQAIGADLSTGARWQGFQSRYGPPPRYGYRALNEQADALFDAVTKDMGDIITINGWAT